MTEDRLESIFADDHDTDWGGDNALQGLLLMSKYLPMEKHTLLQGADHDIIYGPQGEQLLRAGLTEEDALKLASWNWMYDDGSFSCFV